jgi:hypothetical protein
MIISNTGSRILIIIMIILVLILLPFIHFWCKYRNLVNRFEKGQLVEPEMQASSSALSLGQQPHLEPVPLQPMASIAPQPLVQSLWQQSAPAPAMAPAPIPQAAPAPIPQAAPAAAPPPADLQRAFDMPLCDLIELYPQLGEQYGNPLNAEHAPQLLDEHKADDQDEGRA